MTDQVAFGLATSNSHPSGTGSFTYEGSFKIVVQNLAFDKQVSAWAQIGAGWTNIFASYSHSLPGNCELWTAPASNSEGQFVAKYTVNGTTYWDNNGGANYKFPQAFDEFVVLAGSSDKAVLGNASLAGSTLSVNVGVQNLAFSKVVGVVFTTNNWATFQTAFGHYNFTMKSGLEVWAVTAPVGPATEVQFAIFYQVSGSEYWDNNFSRNYKVTAITSPEWGGVS